jgi:hypothetical protein
MATTNTLIFAISGFRERGLQRRGFAAGLRVRGWSGQTKVTVVLLACRESRGVGLKYSEPAFSSPAKCSAEEECRSSDLLLGRVVRQFGV